MPRPVAIVADAGEGAGLGHLSRSSAVAVALRCRGIEARCLAYGADDAFERDGVAWAPVGAELPTFPGHVLLIDTYRLRHESVVRLAEPGSLVVMHDQGAVPESAALVVSVAREPSDDRRRLAGFRYAALRPHFWGLPERRLGERVERLLVTVGSGQLGEVGTRLAHAVAEALPAVTVTFVRGPDAPAVEVEGIETLDAPASLLEPLLDADLVVTAGGQTLLEAAAAGTPCLALPLVENQQRQAQRLSELDAVRLVAPPEPEVVAAAAARLASDAEARRRLSCAGQRTVDGYGALRVAFAVDELARQAA